MNTIKTLASKAKSRLLNKEYREKYSSAYAEINLKSKPENIINKQVATREQNPIKYIIDEERLIGVSIAEKERYLLNTICKNNKKSDN
jgi:hypothetical protein